MPAAKKPADVKKAALTYHRQLRGKIEIGLKKKVSSAAELALAYSPGVAEPCREITQSPEKVYDYTWKSNTILIVTDGTAILGLGDLGPAAALPVMEGKSLLFKMFGGVDCVPLCLTTRDPDEIVETICRVLPAYGGVNLEDIAAPRCFEVEEKLKARAPDLPIFHDDQHGTAVVVLAGLLNAVKVVKKQLKNLRVVINGAGAAGVAIAKLLLDAGVADVIVCDRSGAIAPGLAGLDASKTELAKITNRAKKTGSLADVLPGADVFVGVSAAGALRPELVKSMRKDAIIFALANPDPEIWPADAKAAGAAIVATGRSDLPNQINNVLAFPGLFRGALDARTPITEAMKRAAAAAIAGCVARPTASKIVPLALDKTVAQKVAAAVRRLARNTVKKPVNKVNNIA